MGGMVEDAAMDPRGDILKLAPPLSTDLHLSRFETRHPMGQHYMVVGYANSVFLVQDDDELRNLLCWFAKLIKVRKIQPYG